MNFKSIVEESIVIPSTFKTIRRVRRPKRINLSDSFLKALESELSAQKKAYTNEIGAVDAGKCKEDFKKTITMALTQL